MRVHPSKGYPNPRPRATPRCFCCSGLRGRHPSGCCRAVLQTGFTDVARGPAPCTADVSSSCIKYSTLCPSRRSSRRPSTTAERWKKTSSRSPEMKPKPRSGTSFLMIPRSITRFLRIGYGWAVTSCCRYHTSKSGFYQDSTGGPEGGSIGITGHAHGRGLVHFSAGRRMSAVKMLAENMDLFLPPRPVLVFAKAQRKRETCR